MKNNILNFIYLHILISGYQRSESIIFLRKKGNKSDSILNIIYYTFVHVNNIMYLFYKVIVVYVHDDYSSQ